MLGEKEGLMKGTTKAKAKPHKNSKAAAALRGPSHHIAEVALAYLLKRSPEFMERLAKMLGRTPGAVEQLWSWCEGAEVPTPELKEQLERVKEFLGPDLRSSLAFQSAPVKPAVTSAPFDSSCVCSESDHDRARSVHSLDFRG
jgi:hypothetical protein